MLALKLKHVSRKGSYSKYSEYCDIQQVPYVFSFLYDCLSYRKVHSSNGFRLVYSNITSIIYFTRIHYTYEVYWSRFLQSFLAVYNYPFYHSHSGTWWEALILVIVVYLWQHLLNGYTICVPRWHFAKLKPHASQTRPWEEILLLISAGVLCGDMVFNCIGSILLTMTLSPVIIFAWGGTCRWCCSADRIGVISLGTSRQRVNSDLLSKLFHSQDLC